MERKRGISIEERIVNTMMMLIVVMIGPIEFSAKMDKRNARDATVVMAMAAKPKAAKNLHIISLLFRMTIISLLKIMRSPTPKMRIGTTNAKNAIHTSSNKVYTMLAMNLLNISNSLLTGLLISNLSVPMLASPAVISPAINAMSNGTWIRRV